MIVYEGRSELTGAPIVAILTHGTSNRKLGPSKDTSQLWFLHQDIPPTEAIKNGQDEAICGDCPARGGFCYVVVPQAPTGIWKAYQRGSYAKRSVPLRAMKMLRLGAYGDPASVPLCVIEDCVAASQSHVGYTRQWKRPDKQGLRNYCMASVFSDEEMQEAHELGWRTFRVRSPDEPVNFVREMICPASAERSQTTCATCLACGGLGSEGRTRSVVIMAHGSVAKLRRYEEFKNEEDRI